MLPGRLREVRRPLADGRLAVVGGRPLASRGLRVERQLANGVVYSRDAEKPSSLSFRGVRQLTETTGNLASPLFPKPDSSITLSKIARGRSFPRKRESRPLWTDVDPRLRGGDNAGDFHFLGRARGPWALGMTRFTSVFQYSDSEQTDPHAPGERDTL